MASFPSIRIEGGLLGSDVLDQLVSADLPGQKPADFGLESRRPLTDEIAAVFTDTRALWGVFKNRRERLPENDVGTTLTTDWARSFFALLGYDLHHNTQAYRVDDDTYGISYRANAAEDSPPVHIVGVNQDLGKVAASGRPRLAPHSLVQEYLNRSDHVWGIVTNGTWLRLLRDSTFVRRQAYLEFDLAGILDEQRFQDFAALYRLLHRTRLPRGLADAGECLLEKYYSHSVEQGGRVRDHLRDGVEECIVRLANGFLAHPKNTALNRVLSGPTRQLSDEDLYRQLLRLIYRFLFLLVSEDRGLLSSNVVYREHYGIARLRRLLDQRAAFTEHEDLWQGLRVLWLVFGKQEFATLLDVAPLNGELFAGQTLDDCTITNRELLGAFWHLAYYQESATSPARRVNYAALDVEELGSVYESLLEFHPAVDPDAAGRLQFKLVYGSDRKTTGSYYTPPELVNELIRSALDPVIEQRLASAGGPNSVPRLRQREVGDEPTPRERALLSIRVCDPACGSGHFLLAASRRLGKALARERTGEDEPAPERVRESIRDVISHCIYGVDRNPLAVDLCRVALWLESHTAGKPLSFLDHRIRCGDSLIGVFDLAALKEGIPDKAFDALEGDDKAFARQIARQNREDRTGGREFDVWNPSVGFRELDQHSRDVDAIADDSPEAIRRKKELYEASRRDPHWLRDKEACDLWAAAFFQPLRPGEPAITSSALGEHLAGRPIDSRLKGKAAVLSHRQRFFHWPLEFPEVFSPPTINSQPSTASSGFDVILSNPPWEHVELKEQEFFAARDAKIANAPTKAARTKLINNLRDQGSFLYRDYVEALRGFDATRLFLAHSKEYPLCGRGRINTYAVFAERCRNLINRGGRSGIIVPTGIATDDTTKDFFQSLIQKRTLVRLLDFENRKGIFPSVHKSYKFCLLTSSSLHHAMPEPAQFVFFALDVADLRKPEKWFSLSPEDLLLLNPNTGNCPIFRTARDAELTKAIYRRVPVLFREATDQDGEVNPWKLSFSQGLFNMAADSHHFRTAAELRTEAYRLEGNAFVSPYDRYLPLYEAKMLHQFDHRWATYAEGENSLFASADNEPESRDVTLDEKRSPSFVVQPRYWVREEVVESAIPKYPKPLALALQLEHRESIQTVLCWWAAGYHLNHGNDGDAQKLLDATLPFEADRQVASFCARMSADRYASQFEREFPLTEADVRAITENLRAPEEVAKGLVRRFSPRWLMGWRDICRSTDERTTISSVLCRAAVGDTFLLMFPSNRQIALRLCLVTNLNSYVQDYLAGTIQLTTHN